MSADIELQWEWPAERSSEQKILVQIEKIKAKGGGFFGIGKSPSIADNLPDAQVVSGKILNTNERLDGKSFSLTVPKLEIESIKSGSYAVLGLVENTICICITPVASRDTNLSAVGCP